MQMVLVIVVMKPPAGVKAPRSALRRSIEA
jgi:hypothetical protein